MNKGLLYAYWCLNFSPGLSFLLANGADSQTCTQGAKARPLLLNAHGVRTSCVGTS